MLFKKIIYRGLSMKKLLYTGFLFLIPLCSATEHTRTIRVHVVKHERVASVHPHELAAPVLFHVRSSTPLTPQGSRLVEKRIQKQTTPGDLNHPRVFDFDTDALDIQVEDFTQMPPLAELVVGAPLRNDPSVDSFDSSLAKSSQGGSAESLLTPEEKKRLAVFTAVFGLKI